MLKTLEIATHLKIRAVIRVLASYYVHIFIPLNVIVVFSVRVMLVVLESPQDTTSSPLGGIEEGV